LHTIEQKYLCKFVPNIIKKELFVICKDNIFMHLNNEVAAIALESQILRLGISAKTAKNLGKNL
jgi:hypothetical protein